MKQLGKASWFGWKELFCLIETTEYARNIYSKLDDARECTALTKVLKTENANICMMCWNKAINEHCIILVEHSYNASKLNTHVNSFHPEIIQTKGDDSTVASAQKPSSLKQKLFKKIVKEDNTLADNKQEMNQLYIFLILLISQSNNPIMNILLNILIS